MAMPYFNYLLDTVTVKKRVSLSDNRNINIRLAGV